MRRARLAAGVALAGGAAALVGVSLLGLGDDPEGTTAAPTASGLATVERRTLVERESVEGTLGYGDRRTVINRLGASSSSSGTASPAGDGGRASTSGSSSTAPGATDAAAEAEPEPESSEPEGSETVTALAGEGSLVERGGVLYRVDDQPVVLMYGSTPAYRALEVGMSGDDVEQLEANLAALGYAPGAVDGEYTSSTAAAVSSWQESVGLPTSGAVALGRVVFLPGARRVGAHQTTVGSVLSANGEVMETAVDRRRVSVELDVDKQSLVRKGGRVTVTLPSGRTVGGRISRVGKVARALEDSSGSGGASGDAAASDAELVIDVTVVLASRRGLSRLDQAPVSVGIAQETRRNVLAVPITALSAREGGGYALQVVEAGKRRALPVEPGLFADGLVEIEGRGLREGMRVEAAE